MKRDRNTDRFADALTGLARQMGKTHGVSMVRGKTTATPNVVDVGGGTTVTVTAWVNKPTAADVPVVLLMQRGSVIAMKLEA